MRELMGEVMLDKKRRLALGRLLKDQKVSSFEIYRTEQGYLLKPKISVSAEEVWIFENQGAKKSLLRGLTQEPKHHLGSFAKYAAEKK